MKLATIRHEGRNLVVVATEDQTGLYRLDDIYQAYGLGDAPISVRELLARGPEELERVGESLSNGRELPILPTEDVEWLPPVPDASLVLGVAMNNERLNETAHVPPAGPMFFVKPQKSLVGHGEAIEIADDYGFTFPELELGVIIGSKARHVTEADALNYVAGYTIVNDVTSQGLKLGDSIAVDMSEADLNSAPGYKSYYSWRRLNGEDDRAIYFTYHARSKGADTFGPIGPYLTTANEVPNPDQLAVRGYADGELFAEDSTANYTHPVARIVSWASRYFTLDPGDVIFCGTAAKGTEKYPRAHHNIDMSEVTPVIDIEIEGLGRLSNHVIHAPHPGAGR